MEARIVSPEVRPPHLASRPGADEYAPYYGRYIERVPDGDISRTLEASARETAALLGSALAQERAEYRYGADKWSVKEVVGHVTDSERVFAYRMLRFGRGDETPLPGFEQDPYVPAGEFGERTLESLVDEFLSVRNATLQLVRGLPASSWTRRGEASGYIMSVRALAFVIAGHEAHHRFILETRYLAA